MIEVIGPGFVHVRAERVMDADAVTVVFKIVFCSLDG